MIKYGKLRKITFHRREGRARSFAEDWLADTLRLSISTGQYFDKLSMSGFSQYERFLLGYFIFSKFLVRLILRSSLRSIELRRICASSTRLFTSRQNRRLMMASGERFASKSPAEISWRAPSRGITRASCYRAASCSERDNMRRCF